ncbi:unnamed protein product [Brachionus calyciflorus]|uniref:Uncharacterized protein n=1 Tax=Brachionus calyciflorus TaxID=104777 RepID=A0A814IPT3_9BILA|nr:unnamed protein product [Brachionus calyciflorus]
MYKKLFLPQCLAYLPETDIESSFSEIKSITDLSDQHVASFYDYFEEYYVVKLDVGKLVKTSKVVDDSVVNIMSNYDPNKKLDSLNRLVLL